ncbi:MAG TPA: tetratricopeptide repeat protein, partial [Sporolactobacillaceae bacterium]|nr:tetratricopeptide repeat protein [Sporolactobacillaceae bacterium]
MNAKWWRGGAAVMACAMLVAGCASPPARADGQYSQVAAPPAVVNAAPTVSERPSDAQAAFLEGYRAYLAHDNSRAIDRLKFAADNFPALGDYALYYLALAQHDQGDLSGSAETLERLDRTYPESVMLDRAELQLGETLTKLGRNQEASALAARLLARLPDPPIEQGARIVEARALIALGNPKAAYTQLMTLRDKYPRSDSDAEA